MRWTICNTVGCDGTRTATANHTHDNACDADCNVCGETRTPADHIYDDDDDLSCNVCDAEREVPEKPATTTPAATTTTPAAAEEKEEKKGCGGAINSMYAVLALACVLGFAFVAKKREEN